MSDKCGAKHTDSRGVVWKCERPAGAHVYPDDGYPMGHAVFGIGGIVVFMWDDDE